MKVLLLEVGGVLQVLILILLGNSLVGGNVFIHFSFC